MYFEMGILYGTLEYHYTNETTGSDVLECLALATLYESAIFGVTYTKCSYRWNPFGEYYCRLDYESSTNVRSKVNKKKHYAYWF